MALLGGLWYFVGVVDEHYPIEKWLFWRYAGYWLACAAFSLACLSTGHLIVRGLLGRSLPVVEHLMTSFATGVFAFFIAMFVFGALGLYKPSLFFMLPLAMIAAGGQPLYAYARRAVRRWRIHRREAPPRPLWHFAVIAFGLIGVGMIYFLILTPENAQFDARWKHLALAEDYWAYGGIRRFPEGWTPATYPHLVSYLFTWGFLVPGGKLFDQVELCAHLEFTIFLWTLLGIGGLTRLLVPKHHGQLAWVARFLFPGVLLYDSSVAAGADHIAAMFAVPIATLTIRAWRDLSPRYCQLLAVMLAGGALIKYTSAVMLVPAPVLAIGVRALWLAVRRKHLPARSRGNWYQGPLAAVAVGLVITSPHWLKNIIWYGDPVYPVLHQYLDLRPWIGQDGADMYKWGYKDFQFWRPERSWAGVKETLWALLEFSFEPNDYKRYHRDVPVLGSLFTLLLFPLLFVKAKPYVRQRARLWVLVGAIHLSIFTWYWVHHQDRYLQVLMPVMAAVTAAAIALLWRAHLLTRLCAAALVAMQIIWGGDVYFIQTHAMIRAPIKDVNDLLQAGFRRQYDSRFDIFRTWGKLRGHFPRDARVLLHDNHEHTGIGCTSVSDWQGWQYGINYGKLAGPRAVYELLRSMGVTHLVWEDKMSEGWDSLASDILFFEFATRYGHNQHRVGQATVAEMPSQPPPADFTDTVAVLGCKGRYRTGLYRVGQLTVPVFGPRRHRYPKPILEAPDTPAGHEELIRHAAFIAKDNSCQRSLPSAAQGQFRLIARRPRKMDRRRRGRGPMEIWSRQQGTVVPLPDQR